MRAVQPGHEILFIPRSEEILRLLEAAGRTCYKSEDKITDDSAAGFVGRIVRSGHESVIEHANVTVRLIVDRGVSHELVRHRLAAYSQESTRYANYSQERFGREITVIKPCFWEEGSPEYAIWEEAMRRAEEAYMQLLDQGASPQQARAVLPNSLKTEVVMTANLREWRHVFRLRCQKAAHPQIREVMLGLLDDMHSRIPVLFDELAQMFAESTPC
ncbi:FAD-dependent thymidylate synthase [Desulfovermiculus halophilus]|uniref:FAD-dependent thymidylate synthase n=1 Tax=Desulfovermiculus halophilus TaxID=339722 RepID=UPI000487FACC|nr:FAD-dependent thymidylate synthase [Desulfovermiculus halophilus]